jgi:hypothetical protein
MVDVGCGPFSWLSATDLEGIRYVGLDANRRVIAHNLTHFSGASREFQVLDVTNAALPKADLILCRDLLNHISYLDIYKFLQRFLASGTPLLLACSHGLNGNTDQTGARRWRQLNLTRPPFDLPEPVERIADWIEGHPRRHLCLWTRGQVEAGMAKAKPGFHAAGAPSHEAGPGVTTADIADRGIEFVTVVYRPELLLLRLQARSIRLHAALADIRRIHVIVNEDEPAEMVASIRAFAVEEYGAAAERLTIWTADELLPGLRARGWRKQQTLKLAIAAHIASPKYLVLDAKNHFIRPFDSNTFFTEDGRVRSFWTVQGGSLQNYLRNCLRYFELPEEWCLEQVMPAITPYGLYTELVRSMIWDISLRENVDFAEFFHAPGRDVTEFFLFYTYMRWRKMNLEKLYEYGKRYAATLFARFPNTEEREALILKKLNDPLIKVFGLHKVRVSKLSTEGRARVYKVWVAAGFFPDIAEAEIFFLELLDDTNININ